MKAEEYNSKIMDELFDAMSKDSWHIRLLRWWRTKIWLMTCNLRHNIKLLKDFNL